MTITGAIHKVIVLVAVFTAANTSYAQTTFTNTPQDTLLDTMPLESGKVVDFTQQTITGDTLHLAWEKISESLPTGWIAYLCDYGNCYTTLPQSGTMYPVPPSDYGLMSLHIEAHTNFGTAVVRYALWDINTPNERDTLTWIITSNTTGIHAAEKGHELNVYSAGHTLYVQNPELNTITIEIYDLAGKFQFRYIASTSREILDMNFLADGLYTLCVWDNNKRFTNKIYIGNR